MWTRMLSANDKSLLIKLFCVNQESVTIILCNFGVQKNVMTRKVSLTLTSLIMVVEGNWNVRELCKCRTIMFKKAKALGGVAGSLLTPSFQDLTPKVFWLWGYSKSRVYQYGLSNLSCAIRRVMSCIIPDQLCSAVAGFVTCLQCIIPGVGDHIKNTAIINDLVAFRLLFGQFFLYVWTSAPHIDCYWRFYIVLKNHETFRC